jgi:hypothetical protein
MYLFSLTSYSRTLAFISTFIHRLYLGTTTSTRLLRFKHREKTEFQMVQTLALNLLKFVKLLHSKITRVNLSLDRSVDIATSWKAGVRFPARATNIFLFHSVQSGFGAHPAFYPVGTWGSFPGGKVAGA